MSLVEKELTRHNVERARNHPEFEKLNEAEHKLTPTNPELLRQLFFGEARPLVQGYLSSPDSEESLRLRAYYKPEGTEFTSTLKTRGEYRDKALVRREVETEISPETFAYYQQMDIPFVYKLRAEVLPGITVDFYNDPVEPVIVEVESKDPEVRTERLKAIQEMTGNSLVDRSDDPALTNEAIAYRQSRAERLKAPESLDAFTERVLGEMVASYVTGKNQVVVGLTGMSGSGKSTVTHALQERIVELYGKEMEPIVISTDDYHFGKIALEKEHGAPYTEWDAAKTYDTAELARDLQLLAEGFPIIKRHFSFETEEPALEEDVWSPSPFVIVEGLYAGSQNLKGVRDLHFELPTDIATSVGRDVRRLIIDDRANRAFPTPQSRLRHQIEVALPTYLEQQKPERQSFSASTRPLAERAFMLGMLNER